VSYWVVLHKNNISDTLSNVQVLSKQGFFIKIMKVVGTIALAF